MATCYVEELRERKKNDREGGERRHDHAHPSNFRLILHKKDHVGDFGSDRLSGPLNRGSIQCITVVS